MLKTRDIVTATYDAVAILERAQREVIREGLRVAGMDNLTRLELGIDDWSADETLKAYGAVEDAARYLKTGHVTGLNHTAWLQSDIVN